MSTANKLTYLNDTKQELKQKINNLGGDITNQTTFRQYANQLQTIYDNAPKTSYAEGSNITLSNTLKGKLDYENGIVGIGQTSQTQYNGYNILPNYRPNTQTISGITQTKNSNGTIILNGTASAYILFVDSNSITLEAGTYSLYIKTDNYSNYVTGQLRSTDGQTTYTTTSTKSTFTLTETTEVTYRTVIISGAILTNYELKPMVYSGTSTKEFEPYVGGIPAPNPTFPFPIKTVTGEQEVIVRGSQLFQTPNTQTLTDVTLTKNNDGSLNIVGTAGANRDFATDFISLEDTHLKLGESYYLGVGQTFSGVSIQIVGYNSNNGWVATTSMQSTTQGQAITLFSDNTITKIKFILRVYSGTTINQQNIKIMLNEGSTALPFEPYITPITKQLSLGNIELAKIGTYRDYIYKNLSNGKWIKYNKIIKRTLNGTESINADNSYIASGRFNINQYTDAKYGSQATPNIMSNYYRPNFAIENGSIFVSGVSPDICIIDTRYQNNLNGFKQWLSENTPTIYYVLNTETYTEITDTTLINQLEDIYNIMSNNGTTIIEINGQLPLIIKVRALKGE